MGTINGESCHVKNTFAVMILSGGKTVQFELEHAIQRSRPFRRTGRESTKAHALSGIATTRL